MAFWVVVIPTLACAVGLIQLLQNRVSAFDLGLCIFFYTVTLWGVEAGFHRYASHKSFQCKTWFHYLLLCFGSMAFQGPVIYWAAVHRQHHAHEDAELDPHSPHPLAYGATRAYGATTGGYVAKGLAFFRGHMGWLLQKRVVDMGRYASDLIKNKHFYKAHTLYWFFSLVSLVLPGLFSSLYYQSMMGFWQGLLWGGLIRVFCVHHAVWSVNSFCHLWGRRPFRCKGSSANVAWLAIPTMGGAWHNNHHAFPKTTFNNFTGLQLDVSGGLLKCFQKLGAITVTHFPDETAMRKKRYVNKAF